MEFYVVFDAAGNELWRGSTDTGLAKLVLPEGASALPVPQAAIVGPTLDLDVIRADAIRRIDEDAERTRCLFLTPGAGQALTYQRKEAEANAYAADGTEGPFLTAEAAARGITIAELAAEIRSQVDAWVLIGAEIEGRRMGAKAAVAAAPSVPAITAAADIDWSIIPA